MDTLDPALLADNIPEPSTESNIDPPDLPSEDQTADPQPSLSKAKKAKKAKTGSATSRAGNFSTAEDTDLAKAWKNRAQDPEVANYQTYTTFWAGIHRSFQHLRPAGSVERPQRALEQRWANYILPEVGKFVGQLASIKRTSGSNLETSVLEAKQAYAEINKGKPFRFEQCWVELRECPKFKDAMIERENKVEAKKKNKKIKSESQDENFCGSAINTYEIKDSTSDSDSSIKIRSSKRPRGGKAAKAERVNQAAITDIKRELVEANQKIATSSSKKAKAIMEANDEAIMSKDTSGLDEISKEWYMIKKKAILAKLKGIATVDGERED